MSKRIERINSLIQKELGNIILKEVEFPQGILVTITRVQTSVDLANARIYISVIPQENLKKILEILSKIVFPLQSFLNKRLRMHPIPKIRFVEEKEIANADKIERILKELKKE